MLALLVKLILKNVIKLLNVPNVKKNFIFLVSNIPYLQIFLKLFRLTLAYGGLQWNPTLSKALHAPTARLIL